MKNYKNALRHFQEKDPKIYSVAKSVDYNEWFRDRYKEKENQYKYFHALCRAIIGQQLSGKAAETIYKRFFNLLDGKVTPNNVIIVPDQSFRSVGMSWAKVSYVKDLAEKVIDGSVHLTKVDRLSDKDTISEITKVKGIGAWTVEMFLMFTLKRKNVFSFGDLGLKKGISKVYGIENPTKEQIENIISSWEPYKTYGSIALWESLEN